MFKIENLTSKPLAGWVMKADFFNGEIEKRVKIVMGFYFSFHLILVILNLILFWILAYKIYKKKKWK